MKQRFKMIKAVWRAHCERVDPGEVWDAMIPGESLTLDQVVERTGYSKFRARGALYHLMKQGYAVKLADGRWMKTDGESESAEGDVRH